MHCLHLWIGYLPDQEAVFRVKAKALDSGDNVIKVQMLSDDVNVPVTNEESTRIYSDNSMGTTHSYSLQKPQMPQA